MRSSATGSETPTPLTKYRCDCKPWEQSWKRESPGWCGTCGNPFGDGLDKAREVCLKTEGCLLLPEHEGRCAP